MPARKPTARRRTPVPPARAPRAARPRLPWLAGPLLVFMVALAWRAAFLGRLAAGPLADHLQGDERIYWDWASALLQTRFHATNPFFLGPLYPYFLAGLRILTGPAIGRVLLVQSVLGSAAAALLTDAARRLARPAIAVIVGLAFALYGMIVLFDALVLMESTLVCLEVVLLWLLVRTPAGERPTGAFLALGAVVGLCTECRATGLLLIVPVAALALAPGRPTPGRALRRLAPALGACALVVLPAAVWNQRAAHEFIPFTYNFGYNLYVGNNPAANGEYVDIAGAMTEPSVPLGRADGGGVADGREHLQTEEGLALTPGGSSSLWARRAWAFARRRPLLVLALAAKKLLLAWNHDEVTQIESSALYQQLAGPLGLPGVGTFWFLGLLGLAGLLWPRAPGADVRTLRLCVLLATAGMLPFFVTDRYRVHLVPGLALLAAATLERALAAWRAGDARRLRAFAVACAGAGAIVALPIRGDAARREQWTNLEDVGTRWAEHARTDRAIACYERALELERRLGYDRDRDPATARSRALLAYNYAVALHHEGRDPESLRWFESAVRDDPGEARYVRTLADAYRASGRAREADSTLSRLGGLVGGEAQLLLSEGWQDMRAGRAADAEATFERALRADQDLFGAWTALMRAQVANGDLAAARATLARAAGTRIPAPMLAAHAALIAAAAGDSLGAERALARIPADALTANRLVREVVAEARARMGARARR